MRKITRRAALKGTAAVATCAVAGAATIPSEIARAAEASADPVVALHKRFKHLTAAFFLLRGNGKPRTTLWNEIMDVRDHMIDTRAASNEGLARKLIVYADWGQIGYRHEELLSSIVADACCLANEPGPERLAGRRGL